MILGLYLGKGKRFFLLRTVQCYGAYQIFHLRVGGAPALGKISGRKGGGQADYSRPSRTEVKNVWRLPPHIPLWYAQGQLYLYMEELQANRKIGLE